MTPLGPDPTEPDAAAPGGSRSRSGSR